MVIAALVSLQLVAAPPQTTAPAAPAPFAELPPQQVAPGQCALFLWDRGSGKRIAMLLPSPPVLRAMIDGRITELPRESADGAVVMGFPANSRFRSVSRTYEVRLTILPATAGGAVVRDGSVAVTERDGSAVVLSVAGLAGCPQ